MLGQVFEYSILLSIPNQVNSAQEEGSNTMDFRILVFPPRRAYTEVGDQPQDIFYYLQEFQLVRSVSPPC